jgi:UDP-N-acetylmuramoylalanine--D-glutamate ligase
MRRRDVFTQQNMINLDGKRIGVFGLGITGRAVVNYLILHGADAICVDELSKPEKRGELEAFIAQNGVAGYIGDVPSDALKGCELVVVSPGVKLTNTLLLAAQSAGIECISEIELAYRQCPAHLVAITGSNGKSTTTALLTHLLGVFRRSFAVGNIGTPFIGIVDALAPDDVVCCEVSSYQLEASPQLRPCIALFTNITPDHLDRHATFANYATMKRSLVKNMLAGDSVVYNSEDEHLQPDEFPRRPVAFLPFSSAGEVGPPGAYLENGELVIDAGFSYGGEVRLPRETLRLPGLHNVENALAASLAARILGAKKNHLEKGLSTFEGYEHRIEFVREINGVRWYNDSKATNPEATITALKSFAQSIVLIAGGRDKGTPLGEMAAQINCHCSRVILLGEAADRFELALSESGFSDITRVSDFPSSVLEAQRLAQPGEVVLLSPACASFDMFESFEERGRLFKRLVREL